MRISDAVKVVAKDVIPKLSGREQMAVAAVVDFARKVLSARGAIAELHKAFFDHVNQTDLFDAQRGEESDSP